MAVATHKSTRDREIAEAQKALTDLEAKRKDIDDQIEAKKLLVQAWTNFELTLQGKFKLTPDAPKAPRASTGPRAPRGKRGEMRQQIIDLLRQGELTAESIYTELQADTPKAKQAVANLLVAMKKEHLIAQEAKRGPYTLVDQSKPEAPGEAA